MTEKEYIQSEVEKAELKARKEYAKIAERAARTQYADDFVKWAWEEVVSVIRLTDCESQYDVRKKEERIRSFVAFTIKQVFPVNQMKLLRQEDIPQAREIVTQILDVFRKNIPQRKG